MYCYQQFFPVFRYFSKCPVVQQHASASQSGEPSGLYPCDPSYYLIFVVVINHFSVMLAFFFDRSKEGADCST